MSYRKRTKGSAKLAAMREAADRARMEQPAPDYVPAMPELRRRIVITDYDFGEVTHTIDLYRTNRIDCYQVVADGKEWKKRAGAHITPDLHRPAPPPEPPPARRGGDHTEMA